MNNKKIKKSLLGLVNSDDHQTMHTALLGVGGESVYYVALYLYHPGVPILGYSINKNDRTKKLQKLGITIEYKNQFGKFNENFQMVIYSPAIPKGYINKLKLENAQIRFVEVGEYMNKLTDKYENNKLAPKEIVAFKKSNIAPLYDLDLGEIKLIGVTGTDGKTTTCYMIYHVLKKCGHKVALISTVKAIINDKSYETGLHTTTPSQHALYKFLQKAIKQKCEYVILESTSQGLYMKRLRGIKFDVVGVTNVTGDHLEYHKTYKKYLQAKSLIITKHLKIGGHAVLNRDDKKSFEFMRQLHKNIYTYSLFDLEEIKYLRNKTEVSAKLTGTKIRLELPFKENYNLQNTLCALTICERLCVDKKYLETGLCDFKMPTGRMQIIQKKPFYVIIDFAHTPNGLQTVLNEVHKLKKSVDNKLICVFGCASQRDDTKRPKMGYVACKLCDVVILTAEDPRYESLKQINDQIAIGFKKAESKKAGEKEKCELIRFDDDTQNVKVRRDAIAKALAIAHKGDIIIICGKGHEKSLSFNGVEYPWNDITETKKLLTKLFKE